MQERATISFIASQKESSLSCRPGASTTAVCTALNFLLLARLECHFTMGLSQQNVPRSVHPIFVVATDLQYRNFEGSLKLVQRGSSQTAAAAPDEAEGRGAGGGVVLAGTRQQHLQEAEPVSWPTACCCC